MRFINAYLVGYFILVLGALAALWYGGALQHISATWVVIGLHLECGIDHFLGRDRGQRGHAGDCRGGL